MPFKQIIPILIAVFLLCSCEFQEQSASKLTIKQHPELEKVLSHYRDSVGDKERYEAAKFLIDNMQWHHSYQGEAVDNYYHFMDSVFSLRYQSADHIKRAYDEAYRRFGADLEAEQHELPDTAVVTAAFLIENIDSAYTMWKRLWSHTYDFNHFCNYVLPYRASEEPLSNWRRRYIQKYYDKVRHLYHSQKNNVYMYGICNALNKGTHDEIYFENGFVPEFTLSRLEHIRVASCKGYSCRNVALLRSVGIPVARDIAPQWGYRGNGHEWDVLLLREDQPIPFGPDEWLGDHFYRREDHALPKVFRSTYVPQKEMLSLRKVKEAQPDLFSSPCIKDVTDQYVETSDVTVPLFDDANRKTHKLVYIAVFDDSSWQIVHWAKRKGKQATFTKMGRKMVYLPVYYEPEGEVSPANKPFILQEDGTLHWLEPDFGHTQKVRITRKYRFTEKLKEYCRQLKDGRFQVADNEAFDPAVTIATVGELKENCFHDLEAKPYQGSYRYFRYRSSKTAFGNIAEIEVRDSLGQSPKIKRAFGSNETGREPSWDKAFDGDVLTSFYQVKYPAAWVAAEFEKPFHPTEIRFVPRNDDNFIREGQLYELCYWNGGGWSSLGEQTGNHEGVIYFEGVPQNALLLLHNRTCGKEERIFTYERGEQVWW